MYFKSILRINPQTGEPSGYYRLVESYRNINDRVCHRTLLNVGFLEGLTAEQLNCIQKRLTEYVNGTSNSLFEQENSDEVVNMYAHRFYNQMIIDKRIDQVLSTQVNKIKDWQTIDINSVKNKDVREIGAENMCFQAIKQLGIQEFLKNKSWSSERINLAITQIISRAVYPASELKTSRWIQDNSSVCELTGYNLQKITKDCLYQMSHALYSEKESMEQFLSKKTNELFDILDKIILYDITNTYFEGEKRKSHLAKFGRSKEKRSDAKLVVLAVVINPEGFIKYSSVYEGNMADCKTLGDMVERLRLATSSLGKRAIVVMDAGFATEENTIMLKAKGYDYLCVSRSNLKQYNVELSHSTVIVRDRKKQEIELQFVQAHQKTDYYLKIKSQAKSIKERSMNRKFKERFEAGLLQIEAGLSKKGGVKQFDKVHQRIGRLKQKYPSIHKHYNIEVETNTDQVATSMKWKIKSTESIDANSGIYFLQTSLNISDETTIWTIYNTIREIEYTFRVLKTDLDLRPIYHKSDQATMAHLNLGLLAYWVVNTIRYQLKQKGIKSEWRELVRIMNTQKCVTTFAQNKKEEIIWMRRCSEPEAKVKQIYDALKYKYAPFSQKKSVVHK